MPPPKVPHDVAAIRDQIVAFLDSEVDGRCPCNTRCGVYVFFDYDDEPIYVGQTNERLRVRIRRHLTNQRTDAVAMNVLDPFEVADIEVYPFYDLEKPAEGESEAEFRLRMRETLATAEFSVFEKVLKASKLGAVLNEADIPARPVMDLPPSFRGRIIPDDLFLLRQHPDIRIARRASTIASLAKVISEREVSGGLRRTLLTQVRRLELLARVRLDDFVAEIPEEQMGEETGDTKK